MVALLGREGVSLPLHCGIAELSRDASGSPSRRALSSCSAEGFLFLLGSFSPSFPYFQISQLDQLSSLSLHDSARCSLPVLIHAINNGAHLSRQPSLGQTPPPPNSSLRAAAGKRSNSVSAYCILQESCYLLTVLLQMKKQNKNTLTFPHKKKNKTLLLKTALVSTSFMKA